MGIPLLCEMRAESEARLVFKCDFDWSGNLSVVRYPSISGCNENKLSLSFPVPNSHLMDAMKARNFPPVIKGLPLTIRWGGPGVIVG